MKQKIKELQSYMRGKKIDLTIFIDTSFQKKDPNLRYFTGTELEFCCLAIHAKKGAFLVVPGFEYERAKKLLNGKIKVVKPKIKKGIIEEVRRQIGNARIKSIGVTGNIISMNELRAVRKVFRNIKIKDITKPMLSIRSVKCREEIQMLKKSCSIASSILKECFASFAKFKTEEDVLMFLKKKTMEKNCELSFEPIVASGSNASFPHHTAGNTKLKNGFCVIDFGVKYKGYCSDITRTVYIGKPSKHEINLYNMMLSTQENAIKGISSKKNFGKMADEVKALLGDNFTHGLGHGVGVEIHEWPNLKPGEKTVLKEGMVFTVEPGYYVQGKLGIRIEDDILIEKGKAVILTDITKKLRIFN